MSRVSDALYQKFAVAHNAQFSLKGRTALVTGGARGCGLAFAQGLAEAGADVCIFDVIEPVAEFHSISKDYGVKTAYFK
jgi:phenol 2-monooxygenase